MCKRNLRLLVSLCTIVTFIFAQDSLNVEVTLQSNGNLDYVSDSDIYGFQFSQNGCVTGASGGDAADAGFTVSVGEAAVLGFSFTGSFIPAGSGTLTSLEGDLSYDCISDFVFSGQGGSALTWVYFEGEATSDDGGGGDCVDDPDGVLGANGFTCDMLLGMGFTCDAEFAGLLMSDVCPASC